ncbi:MAG: phage baseplate protein [Phormidesmis priestleyi]|uniref:Phage baseplate protein n=1 Tax=Phormidesmis priestleyi TaxID=268141 RepID=A0A2W4Z0Y3_9CYAN|nr:MAG: phage baseplate protein [Phormidesmis priestleyi]
MRALSVRELLQVWEQGCSQSPTNRALTLLSVACPDIAMKELAELSIGQRDARLLSLREWTFGSHLVSVVNCPSCGDRLELNFSIADICTASEIPPPSTLSLKQEGYLVRFRLPNSCDVANATTQDAVIAQQQLLERCLVEALYKAEPYSLEQLPKGILDAVVEQMALADPQADVKFALTCPACQHAWKSVFDIVSYFWDELNVWAVRLLREVHVLASVYGWHETDSCI